MRITNQTPSTLAARPASRKDRDHFDPGVPNYYGPEDGLSRTPQHQKVLQGLSRGLLALHCRTDIEGQENLPTEGAHMYTCNHSTMFDVLLATALPEQDTRFMATIDLFQNKVGAKLATWMGAFPVNRRHPSRVSLEHPQNVLKDGKGFFIFPEGTFPAEEAEGKIGPFKKGAAAIALKGQAESIIPIAIHYAPNDQPRTGEKIAGYLAAAAVTAGGVLAATASPTMQTIAGTVTGMLTGAYVVGRLAAGRTENKKFWNPTPKYAATVIGGLAGAVAGGLAGGLGTAQIAGHLGYQVAIGTSAAAGLSTLGLNSWWRNRPVAHVKIGEQVPMAQFHEKAKTDEKGTTKELIGVIHEKVGTLKAELSGVPYVKPEDLIETGFPEAG